MTATQHSPADPRRRRAARPRSSCSRRSLKEISDFDAKKLTELKGELEGFVKKQQGLVDDYKKLYPDLRRKWCAQHTDVQTLYTQLKSTHDPLKDPWKDLVSKCICVKQKDSGLPRRGDQEPEALLLTVSSSTRSRGERQVAAAKGRLDILLALAAKLDAALTSRRQLDQSHPDTAGTGTRHRALSASGFGCCRRTAR